MCELLTFFKLWLSWSSYCLGHWDPVFGKPVILGLENPLMISFRGQTLRVGRVKVKKVECETIQGRRDSHGQLHFWATAGGF